MLNNDKQLLEQNDYITKYFFILLNFDSSPSLSSEKRRIATYYLPPEFVVTDGDQNVCKLNDTLNKSENYYPYKDTGATQNAIKISRNGYPINKKDFCPAKKAISEAVSTFRSTSRDESYPRKLSEIEEKLLYQGDTPNWISFPVIARGLCFAILIAQVKNEECDDVLDFLNNASYTLSDKLLHSLSVNGISHPFNDIVQLDDISLICALVASQVGLNDTTFCGDTITFSVISDTTTSHQNNKELLQLQKPFLYYNRVFCCQDQNQRQTVTELLHTHKIRIDRYCHRLQAITLTAHAAIMSRNFSHNVGSHALANPKLYTSIGLTDGEVEKKEIKQRLETFHTYMQGRLDFLARAISKVKDRPEPLFFLNDVMSGFFKQGVLLDTLIEDMEFPAEKIKFHVHIEDSKTLYEWDSEKHLFEAKDEAKEDPIVGIPGGMIGTHALYAFLENILRNAVKYGANIKELISRKESLEIHLQLRECSGKRSDVEVAPAWMLSIWDNVSSDEKCKNIRGFINQPLVKDDGEINHEGHGIQEMKLCADLLSGGLVFPADDDYQNEKCNHCDADEACEPTRHYHAHVTSERGEGISIDGMQPIRCYAKDEILTYDLLMPIPTLLGVVQMGTGQNQENLPSYIKYYDSIEELAEKGAHIGVLLDVGCKDKNKKLEDIARFHHALPFRLMVVTDNEDYWTGKLQANTPDAPPFKDGDIPHKRVHICEYNNDKLKGLLSGTINNGEFLGCESWDATVLQVYDAWLRAYKDLPADKKWKLCVGFDHGSEAVLNKWKSLDDSCVDIYVSAKDKNDCTLVMGNRCSKPGMEDKNSLFFDNHGIAYNGLTISNVGFYQEFGLKEGLTLYQSLASPPQSNFGFGLFVYSLVESALTKVYILDERVAKSVEDPDRSNKLVYDDLECYQAAKLYPLFAFHKESHDNPYYLSSIKEGPILKLDDADSCKNADVLLVHEGVMDMLNKEGKWIKDEDTPKLFSLAPFIVRTSGRGRETRYLHDAISFLEFNEVSGNTYQEMNKPRLVKSLLGSSGSWTSKQDNEDSTK